MKELKYYRYSKYIESNPERYKKREDICLLGLQFYANKPFRRTIVNKCMDGLFRALKIDISEVVDRFDLLETDMKTIRPSIPLSNYFETDGLFVSFNGKFIINVRELENPVLIIKNP